MLPARFPSNIASSISPPTPAPSPDPTRPPSTSFTALASSSSTRIPEDDQLALITKVRCALDSYDAPSRNRFLSAVLGNCDVETLVFISNLIAPRIKRDFLKELPTEISLHILSFIRDPKALARAGCVSRYWRFLLSDESVWKRMCKVHKFCPKQEGEIGSSPRMRHSRKLALLESTAQRRQWAHANCDDSSAAEDYDMLPIDSMGSPSSSPSSSNALELDTGSALRSNNYCSIPPPTLSGPASQHLRIIRPPTSFSYRQHFKCSYVTDVNWRRAGRLLRSHTSPDDGVVTSVALDSEWIVVGLANKRIYVFDSPTGDLVRTLVGHGLGVWCLGLVSRGGRRVEPEMDQTLFEKMRLGGDGGGQPKVDSFSKERVRLAGAMPQADVCNTSVGWGQEGARVVSGACDRDLRVWDVRSGYCLHVLKGHTSTVRCVKVLDGRPIAVSGARDGVIRVWDIEKGMSLKVLEGHGGSVRALEVAGPYVVSGSYDGTAKLWNVDSGECLKTFVGHQHHIYSVAWDGVRLATGSLDSTVRLWDPETGECLALLQGHTSLVGHLQLHGDVLVTGGSDGRVIVFNLNPSEPSSPSLSPSCSPISASPSSTEPLPLDNYSSAASVTPLLDMLSHTANAHEPHDAPISPTPENTTYPHHLTSNTCARSCIPPKTLLRICAHDNSVTCMQFDERFLVTGGNDGHVKLFDRETGRLVRELTEPCEQVWKVCFRRDKCVVMLKRGGRSVIEILSFAPRE